MTITRIEYAVRVKGTQKYLPRSQRRDGRGGSWLEPIDFSDPSSWPKKYSKDMQIRSYASESAAKNLLSSWLKGKFTQSGGWDGYEYYQEGPNYVAGSTREHMRPLMEIVEIKIVLPEI